MKEQLFFRAWQVLIGTMVLSGGDWPGDSNYWTSEEKANSHAFMKMRGGWKDVSVAEVDSPRISKIEVQRTETEEEVMFVKWVTKVISENYPDQVK